MLVRWHKWPTIGAASGHTRQRRQRGTTAALPEGATRGAERAAGASARHRLALARGVGRGALRGPLSAVLAAGIGGVLARATKGRNTIREYQQLTR